MKYTITVEHSTASGRLQAVGPKMTWSTSAAAAPTRPIKIVWPTVSGSLPGSASLAIPPTS